MKLKRKKHKSSISTCNEMCKNYLSVTSNAVRSTSGGGARGGGDNFAVRSRSGGGARGGGDNFAVRSGGTAVLFLLVICLFVLFQISSYRYRDRADYVCLEDLQPLRYRLPEEARSETTQEGRSCEEEEQQLHLHRTGRRSCHRRPIQEQSGAEQSFVCANCERRVSESERTKILKISAKCGVGC